MRELIESLAPHIHQSSRLERFNRGIKQSRYQFGNNVKQILLLVLACRAIWKYTAFDVSTDPTIRTCDSTSGHCPYTSEVILTRLFLLLTAALYIGGAIFCPAPPLPNLPNGILQAIKSSPAITYADLVTAMEKKYATSITIDPKFCCAVSFCVMQNPVYFDIPGDRVYYDADSLTQLKNSGNNRIPHTNIEADFTKLRQAPELKTEIENYLITLERGLHPDVAHHPTANARA